MRGGIGGACGTGKGREECGGDFGGGGVDEEVAVVVSQVVPAAAVKRERGESVVLGFGRNEKEKGSG